MNKEQYLNQRKALLASAEEFINTGKLDEFNSKKAEIETLDQKFSNESTAHANLNTLRDNVSFKNVTDMSGVSVTGQKTDSMTFDGASDVKMYDRAFAKYLLGHEMNAEEKSVFDMKNVTQVSGDHGAVIPESYVQGIWQEMSEQHPIIADTVKTFVKGDLTIITGKTDTSAKWYDEADIAEETGITTGEINLKGYELAKAVVVSWKLKEMSIEDFVPFITRSIAEVMGNALANAIVSGLGSPGEGETHKAQPKGIITALTAESGIPHIVTYSDSDELTYTKLTSVMSKIKSGYVSGSSVYAKNNTIWNTLAVLCDEMGRPLFVPDVTSGGVGRMFGLTVKEEDAVPADSLLFGNVGKGYVMNVNRNISVLTEDHVKARTTDYVGYAIIDGTPRTTEAFSLIKKI